MELNEVTGPTRDSELEETARLLIEIDHLNRQLAATRANLATWRTMYLDAEAKLDAVQDALDR